MVGLTRHAPTVTAPSRWRERARGPSQGGSLDLHEDSVSFPALGPLIAQETRPSAVMKNKVPLLLMANVAPYAFSAPVTAVNNEASLQA